MEMSAHRVMEINGLAARAESLVISAGPDGNGHQSKEGAKNMIVVMKPSTTKHELDAVNIDPSPEISEYRRE